MKVRMAISFVLATIVVASVFTMIQFGPTPGVVADGTVVEISEAVADDTVVEVSEVVADDAVVEVSGIVADDFTVVDEPEIQSAGNTPTTTEAAESLMNSSGVSPSAEPIYLYPDGALAPAPGSVSPDSPPYYDDDDDRDHDDDDDRDHDDDDSQWWGRLATLLSDDDHRSGRDSDDHRVSYEDHDDDHDDDHDKDHDDDHDKDHDD